MASASLRAVIRRVSAALWAWISALSFSALAKATALSRSLAISSERCCSSRIFAVVSFSAIAASFCTAAARRAKVASSAACCSSSRVGCRKALTRSGAGVRDDSLTPARLIPISSSRGEVPTSDSTAARRGPTPPFSTCASVWAPTNLSTTTFIKPSIRLSIWAIGSPRYWPVRRSTEKSMRSARISGSAARQVATPWTLMVWKSLVVAEICRM